MYKSRANKFSRAPLQLVGFRFSTTGSQRSFCLLELILSGRERIRIERRILLRILRCILVSGVQADSQIAIVLAIRESLSAAAFNESVHASPVLLAYTSIVPKKHAF
jgi:hypothetical protein